MRIGLSIFLIAVGAILTFAVHASLAGLDIHVVGWVLMLAGVAGLALYFVLRNRTRHTVVTSPGVVQPGHVVNPAVVNPRTVVSERVYDDTTMPPE
jgi:hypothetical protein